MRPSTTVGRTRWTPSGAQEGQRELPEEAPIALVHDATTTAVLMASPSDLEDLGLGFSLTEGIAAQPDDISALEVVQSELGVEVRMWLAGPPSAALAERRRILVGPTGCGLCGVDSLQAAARPPPKVREGLCITPAQIHAAMAALAEAQDLGAATRAVHAAGLWTADAGLVALREDVGRHNALDKLAGALARAGVSGAEGVLALTSRVSVEMVQKAAWIGAQVVCAVSAPTALAVRMAEQAGLTLVAIARDDGFEVFTGRDRILG